MTNGREIIGQGKYVVAAHQQFVDRDETLVRVIRGEEGKPKKIPVGEAYGFIDCSASKEEIERTIPDIREAVQTPSELKLELMEGIDSIRGDSELLQIAQEARDAGLKYSIRASYPTASNKKTSDELSAILNQAYQSPLYQDGKQFRGGIFYKENGRYVERE